MERTISTSNSQVAMQSLRALEQRLKTVFQKVKPRENYIDMLKEQLLTKPKIQLEKKPKSIAWLFVIMGLVGGVVALILVKKINKGSKEQD